MSKWHKCDHYWLHRAGLMDIWKYQDPDDTLRGLDDKHWPLYAKLAYQGTLAQLDGKDDPSAIREQAETEMIKTCGNLAQKWANGR